MRRVLHHHAYALEPSPLQSLRTPHILFRYPDDVTGRHSIYTRIDISPGLSSHCLSTNTTVLIFSILPGIAASDIFSPFLLGLEPPTYFLSTMMSFSSSYDTMSAILYCGIEPQTAMLRSNSDIYINPL